MNLQIEADGATTYLVPVGRIDFDAAPAFQQAVERVLSGAGQTPPTTVIIDGAKLEYVSSAGLRAVLLLARAAQRAHIAFALCALQAPVREVFNLSGFSQIMAIHSDRETARSQSQPPRT
ncbi:MAG: STAS domain-containing protein [Gammaproteobacteria bacterium]|nr:STAS domain-containing protein [Gammaproteobacteria bacterium]MBV8403816.1 STAS domain-containing protein [Gammaproteobacteria bacterium]